MNQPVAPCDAPRRREPAARVGGRSRHRRARSTSTTCGRDAAHARARLAGARRRTRTRASLSIDARAGARAARRARGAHRRGRARRERRRPGAPRRAAVPDARSAFTARPWRGWSPRPRSRPRARRGRGRGRRTSRCRRSSRSSDAIAAGSFLTEPRAHAPRRRRRARCATRPHRLDGRAAHRRAGALLPRDAGRAGAGVDDDGGVFGRTRRRSTRPRRRRSSRACSALPQHEVVVQCLRMGGGFGGKETQANAWAALAALGARRSSAARCACGSTRAQDMALTGKRHPFLGALRRRLRRRRRSSARCALELFSDGGWSPRPERARCSTARCSTSTTLPTCRTCDVVGPRRRTHHVSHTAFRGFGGPQGMLVIEEILDRIARRARPAAAGRARAQPLPRRATRRTTARRCGDDERIARIWAELQATQRRSTQRRRRDRARSTRAARTSSAASRSRR